MFSQLKTVASRANPIDPRLLVYGVIFGLIGGSFRLNESVDIATAFGIALFIQTSVGFWLGTKLTLGASAALRKWLCSIKQRLAVLRSGLERTEDTAGYKESARAAESTRMSITGVCMIAVPLGIWILSVGVIGGIIDSQTDIYSSAHYYLQPMVGGAVVAAVSLTVLCTYVWKIEHRVTRLERGLEDLTVAIQPGSDTQQIDRALDRAQGLVGTVAG